MPCRRVLRVCLQFRLRLRRVILIPFPLLCLLPLKLLSGFHLFLPFLVILFLTGFSLRSVCDGSASLFNNFTCLIITPYWSLLLQLGCHIPFFSRLGSWVLFSFCGCLPHIGSGVLKIWVILVVVTCSTLRLDNVFRKLILVTLTYIGYIS